jgi:hypothetical protein
MIFLQNWQILRHLASVQGRIAPHKNGGANVQLVSVERPLASLHFSVYKSTRALTSFSRTEIRRHCVQALQAPGTPLDAQQDSAILSSLVSSCNSLSRVLAQLLMLKSATERTHAISVHNFVSKTRIG